MSKYVCEVCQDAFADQFRFFEHLKSHYELPAPQASSSSSRSTETEISNNVVVVSVKDEEFVDESIEDHGEMGSDPNYVETGEEEEEEEDFDMEDEYLEEDNVCPICDKSFQSPDKLAAHTKRVHPEFSPGFVPADIKPTKKKKSSGGKRGEVLKCPDCDRVFNHRNSLVYHMRSHTGERPHQCEQCGKSFFATSALKVHMRLHTGEKPYKCEHCGRNFRQWGDLKYHVISIHSDIRQYQCEYCGKDFARKYSLIVHTRIHTGERNYQCDFCPKTFRAASYLQNHRRIHTGEKPHACELCGKPFRVRSDMKRHMASHNRDTSSGASAHVVAAPISSASIVSLSSSQINNSVPAAVREVGGNNHGIEVHTVEGSPQICQVQTIDESTALISGDINDRNSDIIIGQAPEEISRRPCQTTDPCPRPLPTLISIDKLTKKNRQKFLALCQN